jgi:hypothetical protein
MPPLPKTCPKTVCPRKGVAFLSKAFFAKKNLRCGSEIAPDPRRGNPVSPLPRVRRTIIYWIGGLLGSCQAVSRIVSASGVSRSLRRSTRCCTGCGLNSSHRRLDDRDLVPVRFLARSLSSGGSRLLRGVGGALAGARLGPCVADKAPSPFRAAIHSGKVPPRSGAMLAS